jgi:hypothetical protein
MKALTRGLTTQTTGLKPCTLTPASGSYTTPASGPGIREVLNMRVGCWSPPVHVTLV